MRTLIPALPAALILALSGPISTAATAAEGALPPGRPMGVHKAQLVESPITVIAIVAAAAVAIGLASSNSASATSAPGTSP